MMQEWFGFWDYSFMRSALLAIVLIMPLFSMLGTLVVNNGMSFFSDALGHSALTGVGIGLLLGVANHFAGNGGVRGDFCAADEPDPSFADVIGGYRDRGVFLRGIALGWCCSPAGANSAATNRC